MSLRGTLLIEAFHSRCLEGNALGDSAVRDTPIYLPEGYDASKEYPLIVWLGGVTSSGLSAVNWSPWNETFPERVERLINERKLPPCVVVMPDGFTKLGGAQYINSSATGDYEDYIAGEIIPWMRKEFNAGLTPGKTAVAGKSSGGYGAFVHAARHPDLYGYLISHSGDCYFEYCYFPEFPLTLNELRKQGGPQKFFETYNQKPKGKDWFTAMNCSCMAACYSPNPASPWGFDYPFDLESGEFREDVWKRWLMHDPVRMVERAEIISNLKKLSGIYIEAGLSDEWFLNWGAKILVKRLREAGLQVEHREFEGGHMNVQYRYDESLVWLGASWSR